MFSKAVTYFMCEFTEALLHVFFYNFNPKEIYVNYKETIDFTVNIWKKKLCCIVSYQIYIKKSNLYLLYQIYSEYETSDKTSIYYKHK